MPTVSIDDVERALRELANPDLTERPNLDKIGYWTDDPNGPKGPAAEALKAAILLVEDGLDEERVMEKIISIPTLIEILWVKPLSPQERSWLTKVLDALKLQLAWGPAVSA